MNAIEKHGFASGVAVGAAAAVVIAGGYFATAGAAPAHGQPVNPPASASPSFGAPTSFANIVAKVAPAVVSIDVVERPGPNPVALGGQQLPFPFDFNVPGGQSFNFPGGQGFTFKWVNPQGESQPAPPQRASGSGFFISPDGYVVTNNHVIERAEKIIVHTSDGRALPATLVGADPDTDLAVLRVSGGPFSYVSFENSARPRVGDWVVAVGNPFGLGGTATAGIVSALGRENVSGSSFVNYMQIDAPINHGNSGGPTFDVEGRVVGVNAAIYSPSGGSVGIGFDIPADVAARVTQQLIAHGAVARGYVGASIQTLTPELAESLGLAADKGAVVDQLTPGGPAEHSGLRSGDVIVAVNGEPATDAASVTRLVSLTPPGGEVNLQVLRGGVRRDVAVRAGLRPTEASLTSAPSGPQGGGGAQAPTTLGLQVAPDPNGGLLVQGVDPNSDAASEGLRQGDVILRAGLRPVQSAADLASAASAARRAGRDHLPLLVARGGQHVYLPVRVAPAAG